MNNENKFSVSLSHCVTQISDSIIALNSIKDLKPKFIALIFKLPFISFHLSLTIFVCFVCLFCLQKEKESFNNFPD